MELKGQHLKQLAVMDVDGTLINGNSQHMLVWHLARNGMLPFTELMLAIWWFIKYRLHLVDSPDAAMNKVLRIFKDLPVSRMEQLLSEFCLSTIFPRVRKDAVAEIIKLKAEGKKVILLSSTLDFLVKLLAESVAVDCWLATELEKFEGKLTGRILGNAVYGEKKYFALKYYADAQYENWQITDAYGDHNSDAYLIGQAENPVAVCPDRSLKKIAQMKGWRVVEWK